MSSSPESPAAAQLPSGLVAFVKRDCPTCELVEGVLEEIAAQSKLTVYTQDDPKFPSRLASRGRYGSHRFMAPSDRGSAYSVTRRERS